MKKRVRFAARIEVFAAPPPAPKAVPAPVAGRVQKRPYAQRKLRTTGRASARDRALINEARSAHAFETAFAASERDTAEAVMRLLWRMKGTREWCETGAGAVAEDAARHRAAEEEAEVGAQVAALVAELAQPSPTGQEGGRLSVEDVWSVLLPKDGLSSAC